jgi:hypothetical protein
MKMLVRLRYILLLPLVALILFALSWAIADGFFYQARLYEKGWIKDKQVNNQKDWDAAVKWAQMAIQFNPYNPNYPEMLGRLYFWRFFVVDNEVQSFAEAQSVTNEGLQYLRQSIEMRPTWPLAWASLVELKSIGGQIDYEYEQAWNKSVELGDWEPAVQTKLLKAGLIHWFDSNPILRKKTVDMFVAMTSKPYSERRAIRAVDSLDAWPLVCDVLVDPILTPDAMRTICAKLARESQ